MESISPEIREKAHRVCRDYLGGVWETISANEIIIEKIIGGYLNLTLKLSLPPNLKPQNGEPTQIIMKIKSNALGEGHFGQMTENIIAVILSENNLGPKVYGVFDSGRLDEFVISTPLVNTDLHNPRIISAIMKKLANFHSLTLPITKDPNRMYNQTKEFLKITLNDPRNKLDNPKRKEVFDQLMSINPEEEIKWLREIIASFRSHVVYCHGDLQINNILLLKDSLDDPIIQIVDLDLCGYNYRGYDIASLATGFCMVIPYPEPPYIKLDWDQFPTVEELKFIFRCYLEEFQKVNNITLDLEKEEKSLMKETKVFSLLMYIFYSSFGLMKNEETTTSTNPLDWVEFSNIFLKRYKVMKKDLLQNYFHEMAISP